MILIAPSVLCVSDLADMSAGLAKTYGAVSMAYERRKEARRFGVGTSMIHPIIQAIEERNTVNLFDASHPVSDDQIHELIRLATRAPTAFNLQNWRFIAARTSEAKARLRAVAWDQAKITEAGVTFIVVGQLAHHETLPERLQPAVDAGIMPSAMVPAWAAGAKSLYFEQAPAPGSKRPCD